MAVSKEKLIGYIVLEYDFWGFGGRIYLNTLRKRGYSRKRGIGSELIKYAENKCKKEELFTSTNQSNKPMQILLGS